MESPRGRLLATRSATVRSRSGATAGEQGSLPGHEQCRRSEPDEDGDIGATGRAQADAPEIDGAAYLRNVPASLAPGDIVAATIEDADAHDLFGVIAR